MYATQIQIHEDKLYLYEKFKFNLKLRYYFSIKVNRVQIIFIQSETHNCEFYYR